MARILLLTPQPPYPPHQGTTLRNLNIIRGLSDRHDLALLSYANSIQMNDQSALNELSRYCQAVTLVPIKNRSSAERFIDLVTKAAPDMALRLQSDEIAETLQRLADESRDRSIDIIQIEGIEMANVISHLRRAFPEKIIVFDNHNAETELQRRAFETDLGKIQRWPLAFYSWIQTRRLERYERWACKASDHVVAVSQADKNAIKRIAPEAPITVIPNAIDPLEYSRGVLKAEHKYDLVYVGKMDYRPNIDAVLWFYETIWPKIRSIRADTQWVIVGQNPHARLDKLRSQAGISITGKVNSVQPYLSEGAISIMPLRIGGGTRLKLLEAMAAGMAIVSTKIGAEGFDVVDQEELIIADGETEFAEAVLRLLSDPEMGRKLGERARAFASQYDFRQIIPKFDQIYDSLLANRPV